MTASDRILGGRYEVGDLLGYGGMAEVHQGRDLRLGRDVAIKMLRTDLARDATFQTRFRREAQNAASLNHPAIVAVYDTGEEKGTDGEALPYIVMEFVNGRTLKEVLTAEGPLAPRRALEIVADVCGALEFSHRHGIIHRDIKPGNIMLNGAGQVKVMDFGIARALASTTATMTQTSAVIGTAQYLSPEQARGEAVDARSDVYATGCVLYELVIGAPPFTGDSPVSVAYQHVREDPKPPSERDPDVPADFDAVVLKALAKNPANRYQSAAEMRADLLRAANGRPVHATPVLSSDDRTQVVGAASAGDGTGSMPAARVTDPGRRRRAVGVLVALGLLLVLGIAATAIGLYLSSTGNEKALLPDVTDQPVTTAEKKLTHAHFQYRIVRKPSSEEKKDRVLAQSPHGLQQIKVGTTVKLTVGQGPRMAKVPRLNQLTSEQAAENVLEQAHLKATFVDQDSTEPEGFVVTSNPRQGELVKFGATVTVYLSRGNLATVPTVIGKSEAKATEILHNKGFEVKTLSDEDSDAEPGTVTNQTPGGGDPAQTNSTVTITVAGDSKSPSPAPSTSTSGSPSPSPSPSTSRSPILGKPED
ncbi:MAG: Stk1 family PASTA domain-containing Ser/Thr kinase [Actinocatenispora sp.]